MKPAPEFYGADRTGLTAAAVEQTPARGVRAAQKY